MFVGIKARSFRNGNADRPMAALAMYLDLKLRFQILRNVAGRNSCFFTTSRSASEQLLSGEVWFRDLRLEHLMN